MIARALTYSAVVAAVLVAAPALERTAPTFSRMLVPQAAAADISINIFFEPLSSHGRWLSTDRYGYVWVPARVDRRWRPYTEGHWDYTRRYGWVWVSDEPWGWATYHYGRWAYDDGYGWYWVPGNKWAPAWVSWQRGDEYIGWAPLPPSGSGYAFSTSISSAAIGVGAWRFVAARDFLAPDLGLRIVTADRNDDIFRRTRPAGAVTITNNVVVNNIINVQTIERVTKQQVVVREVRDTQQPPAVKTEGNSIIAYRPQISDRKPDRKPKDVVEARQIENKSASVKADAPAQGSGKASISGANGQPLDAAPRDARTVRGTAPARDSEKSPTTDGKSDKTGTTARRDKGDDTAAKRGTAGKTTKDDGAKGTTATGPTGSGDRKETKRDKSKPEAKSGKTAKPASEDTLKSSKATGDRADRKGSSRASTGNSRAESKSDDDAPRTRGNRQGQSKTEEGRTANRPAPKAAPNTSRGKNSDSDGPGRPPQRESQGRGGGQPKAAASAPKGPPPPAKGNGDGAPGKGAPGGKKDD